jgi:hypothetical protein
MFSKRSRVSPHRAIGRPHAALTAAAVLALSGCSAGPEEEADGPPDFTEPSPTGSGGRTPAPAPANPSASSGANAPIASAGEQNPANGAPIAPGTNTGNATSGSGNPNSSGANGGAGGASMVDGANNGNAAGSTSMGSGGSTGEQPVMPPQGEEPAPVTPPPVAPPLTPTAPDITCPSGATFCSGFESNALPGAARLQGNPAVPQFDMAVRRSGNQSIAFPAAADGFNIREVVVPIPGQTFWARLFIQTSTAFGDNDHDSLFVGSTATADQDNNQEHGPEFSEQGNQVLLNADDDLFSAGGHGFPSTPGPTLSAGTWHCVEAFFDGGSGDVQILADGALLIDAPGFKQLTYQTFRFGYLQFPGHPARSVWFDDVVVAPDRVGCN